MVLQILWCHRKPLSFPVAPRYPTHACFISALSRVKQKPVSQAAFWKTAMFDSCFTILFSPKGEATSWTLSPGGSELFLFLLQYKFSGAATSWWALFCSLQLPGIQDMLLYWCSKSDEAETTHLGGPPGNQSIDICFILLFPSQGRRHKLGFTFRSWVVPGWGRGWYGQNEWTFPVFFSAVVLGFELA